MNSNVYMRALDERKTVLINESYANLIEQSVVEKWQDILDMITEVLAVPAGLIMRLHAKEIEVFAKSRNLENPYKTNERASLGLGLYCETVIGTSKRLVVPDALEDNIWRDNPDVELDMIHYLGLPLKWPNGESFGTVCVLDNKNKIYTPAQFKMFDMIRGTIEKDLDLVDKYFLLNKAMKELEEVNEFLLTHEKNKLTGELVANISHEISTPIGVALTTASYVGDATQRMAKTLEYSERIHTIVEGAEMVVKNLQLASDLIQSFKTITMDQAQDRMEYINLSVYLQSIIKSLKYELKRSKVNLKLEVPEQLSVHINSGAFSQVVINLIMNAIHHAFLETEDRVIELTLSSMDDNVLIAVMDNGCGIKTENIDEIFKPFKRLHKETTGSGMGLSIVKEIVEKTLHGCVECISEVGRGSEFKLILPLNANKLDTL
ncbi:MAG: GAF domain-containing sensor histidine kinase [Clostridiales bacterium]|nr:GAF domain-containing sensor histidine kinase [Clostridiales bacterium]